MADALYRKCNAQMMPCTLGEGSLLEISLETAATTTNAQRTTEFEQPPLVRLKLLLNVSINLQDSLKILLRRGLVTTLVFSVFLIRRTTFCVNVGYSISAHPCST